MRLCLLPAKDLDLFVERCECLPVARTDGRPAARVWSRLGVKIASVTEALVHFLQALRWPGAVRVMAFEAFCFCDLVALFGVADFTTILSKCSLKCGDDKAAADQKSHEHPVLPIEAHGIQLVT